MFGADCNRKLLLPSERPENFKEAAWENSYRACVLVGKSARDLAKRSGRAALIRAMDEV